MSLQIELLSDPLNRGYAVYIPQDPGMLVNMMNDLVYQVVKSKFITARTILADHGVTGATILDKLEVASSSNSAIKWAMKFMLTDGIDIGHPTTRGLLDQLADVTLTTDEVNLLKNMALQPGSRAEVLGLPYVRESDIRIALGL